MNNIIGKALIWFVFFGFMYFVEIPQFIDATTGQKTMTWWVILIIGTLLALTWDYFFLKQHRLLPLSEWKQKALSALFLNHPTLAIIIGVKYEAQAIDTDGGVLWVFVPDRKGLDTNYLKYFVFGSRIEGEEIIFSSLETINEHRSITNTDSITEAYRHYRGRFGNTKGLIQGIKEAVLGEPQGA